MHARLPTVLVAALALQACAGLGPADVSVPMAAPARYPDDAGAGDSSGPAAVAVGWQDYYADPRLRALIAAALASNPDMRIALLRVDEARAALGIARARQFPAVALGAQASTSRLPGELSVTGRPMITRDNEVAVTMSGWELDLWGRVRSLKQAALENYLASDAARRAVGLALVAQVADSYLQLREFDERLALALNTVASRSETYRIFRRRYEVGAVAELDLIQVSTLLSQAQALAAQLAQARALQAHALAQLVGGTQDTAPPTGPFDDGVVLMALGPGLPSALLEARPDIAAAMHRLHSAHADIDAARAALYPRISLTAAVGTASAELDGLFRAGSRAWTFAPAVALPLFDGGANRAGLELARTRRELALADYDKTVQGAFREVSDALASGRALAEQVSYVQATLTAQQRRAHLATLRYNNGATAYFEVLDAQRDLLAAEQELVQTRRALLSSQVALYAALGGGSVGSGASATPPPSTRPYTTPSTTPATTPPTPP